MEIQKKSRIKENRTTISFIRRSWIIILLLVIAPFLANLEAQDNVKNNNLNKGDTSRNLKKEVRKPVNKQVDTSKTYPYNQQKHPTTQPRDNNQKRGDTLHGK